MKRKLTLVVLFVIFALALSLTACGECTHVFSNGVCTKCDFACDHVYTNGVCQTCNFNCPHNGGTATCKDKAVCQTCNTAYGQTNPNEHVGEASWQKDQQGHKQAYYDCCNAVVVELASHVYQDGVCLVCSYQCVHYGGTANCQSPATCLSCGSAYGQANANVHLHEATWQSNQQGHTKAYYDCCGVVVVEFAGHTYENGVCSVCNYPCIHSGGNATCKTQAVCETCNSGYGNLVASNHEGELVWDKTEQTHKMYYNCCLVDLVALANHLWEDGRCSICLYDCQHSYENSVCTKCTYACPHKWVNTVCTECNKQCTSHVYENGVCSVCGNVCSHSYVDGVCKTCTMPCKHNYVNGLCAICTTIDPNWTPSGNVDASYQAIISKFKALILYKYVNEELPPRGTNEPDYMDALYAVGGDYSPNMEMGYAVKDINGDGVQELLLMGRDSRLYALFTVVDGKATVVKVFSKGMGYLTQDGMVFYNVKQYDAEGGQTYLENNMTRLVGANLEGFCFGWYDADNSSTTDTDRVRFKTENNVKTEITEEEYKSYQNHIYEYYWSYATRLTKQANLRFNTALIESGTPTTTANFGSYQAIINTFGLMHSEVAGGKYERSKWIAGAYDNGMIFVSDQDFVTYNRLLGACVLVQNSSTAKFGYALKDLNNDGIDELVLLESKFYVLAVFTMVDNTPVLLDTYNDCRMAFIDKDGLIHVKQRILTGYKTDSEYFVYQVQNGALNSVVALKVTHDLTGVETNWYNLVSGTVVAVTKEDWDPLYAQYALDIGTVSATNCYKYTAANSGLIFTLA